MPVINRVAEFQREIAEWRQDFHRNPELLYDVQRTAARVADLLQSFGVDEDATGIGRTGVVAVIKGRNGGAGKVIGLRADMDALPMAERTGKPYASANIGLMHACGHDGHTAMLLGAAMYLGLPAVYQFGGQLWAATEDYVLLSIPLYILLGEILVRGGATDKMYRSLADWLNPLPGGLIHTNIGASALFSGCC